MRATVHFASATPGRIAHRLMLGLSLSLATAASALAGTEMHMTIHDLTGQSSAPLRTWVQDGKLRIEERGDMVMIFRDEALYALQPSTRTYHVMDRDSMQRIAAQVNPALQQMREQLAKLPPEQRAQVEKLMGGQLPGASAEPKIEMRRTSRSGEFAGHACKYVEVLEDGVLTDELCVTDAKHLQGADELMNTTRKLSTLVKEWTGALQIPGMVDLSERHSAKFDELGGIPVLARHYVDGQPHTETRLESIRTQTLPATLFDIPAGYTRKDMLSGR